MTMNIAFDVVIGLVFVYLLYSLYATILMEIISSLLNLRAKNLCYTLSRMLMDENRYESRSKSAEILERIWTTVIRVFGLPGNMKHPELYARFFSQPSVKYLSSGGLGNRPSYMSAASFSKGLLDAIKSDDAELSMLARIEEGLKLIPNNINFQQAEGHIQLLVGYLSDMEMNLKALVDTPFSPTTKESLALLSLLLHKIKAAFSAILEIEEVPAGISAAVKKHLEHCEDLKAQLASFSGTTDVMKAGGIALVLLNDIVTTNVQVKLMPESLEVSDTRMHLKSLLEDANNDLGKFKILIEQWYDSTMERASGWFKQTTQVFLFIIAIALTCLFDIDSIAIVKKLSKDEAARDQLVKIAVDFSNNNQDLINTVRASADTAKSQVALKARLDSLTQVKKIVLEDIKKANKILFPEKETLKKGQKAAENPNGIWGYILTILALSLGAPFWFDLLNKLVKLRTSAGNSTESEGTSTKAGASVSNRSTLTRVG